MTLKKEVKNSKKNKSQLKIKITICYMIQLNYVSTFLPYNNIILPIFSKC